MSKDAQARALAVRRVLAIGLVCNLGVAGAEAFVGIMTGSLAVVTDSIHSLTDAAGNIIGLLLIRAAAAPPDPGHPYGHRKIEMLAGTALGVLIGATAIRFGYEAVTALIYGRESPTFSNLGLGLMLGTLVVNVGLTIYVFRKAKELSSPYLLADAAHTLSDIAVKIFVVGAFVMAKLGLEWADPIGALVVLVIIVRVAWHILSENLAVLVDAAVVPTDEIKAIASSHPEVAGCHRVRSRGPSDAIHIDMHLQMDGDLTLERAHDIAHEVEDQLREAYPGIIDVTAHLEPDSDDPEPL
jgi:cation diffusion facilitator family transporter